MEAICSHIIIATHLLQERRKQVVLLIRALLLYITEVTLVFLLIVDEGLHSIVASLHAELDALVQNRLWLVRSVHIDLRQRLDVLLIVIDGGIDDTVANGLGYNLLSLLNALEAQLLSDVGE